MDKSSESNLRFALRRFSRFFKTLLGNRNATIGLVLLLVFIFAAVGAPLLFPGNPQGARVGAQYAEPDWVKFFPEGYYLSQNMAVVNDPTFSSPSSLQEWSYSSVATSGPYTSVSWVPPTSSLTGAVRISSSSTSNSTVTMSKTFLYPYKGPPDYFTAKFPSNAVIGIVANGASASQPILVTLFLERGTDQTYDLWTANITENGVLETPSLAPSSNDQIYTNTIGYTQSQPTFSSVVFSNVNNYTYGVRVTFTGPSSVTMRYLGLYLYGTAYGVLGTDYFGNDLFKQLVWGARVSMFVGLLAAGIGIGLGLLVGLLAGYGGGLVDEGLMRFTDMMLVIPVLPLLLVLITVLGPNLLNIILLIGFLGWMGFARVIRSSVLSLKERPFVEAAKAAGAGTRRILGTHIFPNVVSLTYVNLSLAVPAAVLTEAALSFLGLGSPNDISWGQIINRAQETGSLGIWWWLIPPGLAIALVSLSFVLIGYALDEMFNPKLRKRQ